MPDVAQGASRLHWFPALIAPVALAVLTSSCQGSSTPATPQSPSIQPTYTDIANKIFVGNCTTTSCHGQFGRGGLILTPDQAYENLVNVAASNDAAAARGKKRVVPGDPDNSYLIQKLEGPAPDEGDRMPQNGTTLDPAQIAIIRQWIANGAKKD